MEKNYEIYDGKQIKIMTCSNCNMKCKQCYIPYSGNFESKQLASVVKNLKKNYEVFLNGTEPLLNDYLDSFKIAGEKIVLTNGLVFKNNLGLIDKIKQAGIERVCMSYQFNIQKDIESVGLSFLDELFPKIREKGIDVELMCTITSKNYDKLDLICNKALELKANYVYLIEFMYQGNAISKLDKSLMLNDAQRAEFFKNLNEVRKTYNKDELFVYRSGNFGKDSYTQKQVVCGAGREIVTMTPDFKIYPCNFLIGEEFCLGFYDGDNVYIDKNKQKKICGDFQGCLWTKFKNKNENGI